MPVYYEIVHIAYILEGNYINLLREIVFDISYFVSYIHTLMMMDHILQEVLDDSIYNVFR